MIALPALQDHGSAAKVVILLILLPLLKGDRWPDTRRQGQPSRYCRNCLNGSEPIFQDLELKSGIPKYLLNRIGARRIAKQPRLLDHKNDKAKALNQIGKLVMKFKSF